MSTQPVRPDRCGVLHLVWSGRIGGIELQVAAIVRHAAERGTFVHRVCLLDGQGPVGDALVAEGLAYRLGLRTGWDFVGLCRLWSLLRRLRPRIVHIHAHAVGANLIALVALPHAVRVYTEHSPRSLGRDYKFLLLYTLLRRSISRFIALSPAMARAIEGYGVNRARMLVIPNAVSVPPRAPSAPRRGEPTVGIVARLEPQKRVDLFVDTVAELRQRGVQCSGLVVGGGSRCADLKRQVHQLGLINVIEFAGEQEDVVPWLDRMDVFLMSSASEPYAVAALEAMARGVPVVAMPCPGGLSDLVARGGLPLPDRAPETAATAVASLFESSEARLELRARGEAMVVEHSLERVFAQLERLYLGLAGSPSREYTD